MTATGELDLTTPSLTVAGEGGRATIRRITVEHLAWALIVLAAAGLRLVALGVRPLTQAEGARALGSWQAARYAPQSGWPGGLTDAVTALLFKLFGSGDALARVAPALSGVALVASFWLLRPFLGRVATVFAALLAALSPVLVYDARSVDGMALGGVFAIGVAATVLHLTRRPRAVLSGPLIALLAFALATDAVFAGLLLLLGLWWVLRIWWLGDEQAAAAWRFFVGSGGRRGTGTAGQRVAGTEAPAQQDTEQSGAAGRYQRTLVGRAALFFGGAALLLACSRFGIGFERLRPAVAASWAAAFVPTRPGVPWHYALDVLAGYELPLLVLGLGGAWLAVRRQAWRADRTLDLLLTWLVGGLLLDIFMASRQPSTLLLTVLPMCLLGGVACDRALRVLFGPGPGPGPIDVALAAGLFFALVFLLFNTYGAVTLGTPRPVQLYGGPIIAAGCLAGAWLRFTQDGRGTALPIAAVLALAMGIFALHGAGSVAFETGDEFLAGQGPTPAGVALAGLLETNGGGVGTVDDSILPPLAWYLRDSIASGGHGGAKLVLPSTGPVAGYHNAGAAAIVGRSWFPGTRDGEGMIRWWVYRKAWGVPRDLTAQLVVEDR